MSFSLKEHFKSYVQKHVCDFKIIEKETLWEPSILTGIPLNVGNETLLECKCGARQTITTRGTKASEHNDQTLRVLKYYGPIHWEGKIISWDHNLNMPIYEFVVNTEVDNEDSNGQQRLF